MPTESAVAYVSIVASARGVGKQIEKEINPDAVGVSVGNRVGAGLTQAIGKTLQAGATTVVAAGAAAIGAALVKGFNRLTAIDQATAKLKGLGNSASDITAIMDNALASVKGTAFGLDAAAGVAAGAVAAGIKPGQQLQRVLGLVADSATIAGTDLNSMGSIFNKVAASGKLQGDVIAQLQDAGVPVLQFVAKEIGKTAAETSKLASDGKIDFETFANAMEAGLGGAAKSSGDTFTGALANVGASLGRIGANLEKGFFPKLAPLFQQITTVMGPLEDRATVIGEAIGTRVNPALDKLSSLLTNGTDAFKGMSSVLAPLGGLFAALGAGGLGSLLASLPGLGGLAGPLSALGGPLGLVAGAFAGLVAVSPELQAVFGSLFATLSSFAQSLVPLLGALVPVAAQFVSALTPMLVALGSGLSAALMAILPLLTSVASALVPVATFLSDNATAVLYLAGAIGAGVLAYRAWTAATAAVNAVQQVLIARSYGAAGATYAQATAGRVATVVNNTMAVSSRIAAAAQWLFNAALRANPIGLVITAITALVAGLVWFFTQTKLGQAIVKTVFAAIQTAVAAVGTAFTWLWENAIGPALNAIGGAVSTLWTSFISPIFELIGAIIAAVWNNIVLPVFKAYVWYLQNVLGAAISFLWEGVIKPVFGFIGALISAWWNGVVMPVFSAVVGFLSSTLGPAFKWLYDSVIKPVWDAIGKAIGWAYDNVIKPVIDNLKWYFGEVLPAAFTLFKDAIGKAWQAIQDAAKAPIRFVVETVINDGIIGNFNKVAEFFGTKKISEIQLPKGFAGGGYTGDGGKYQPAGIVHAGEYVFTKEQTARIGVGRLAAIANNGYANGGLVGAATGAWDWIAGKAGKAWDWAANAAQTAASVVSDPMGTLGKLVNGIAAQIPGAGGMLELAKSMGGKILDGAVEALRKLADLGTGVFGGNGQNGQLPSTDLGKAMGFAPGSGVGPTGGLLRKAAANAWNAAYQASGGALGLTEGYRDLAAQQYRWSLFKKGGNLAAAPGTSQHGFGLAADVAAGQGWLRANGSKFGWINTGLGFSQREPWHFEFKGVPQLAAGAMIGRRPGGTLVNVGEGRYDEAVVPLSPSFKDSLAGGGSQPMAVYVENPWTGEYMRARMVEVADDRVASADGLQRTTILNGKK